MNDLKQIKRHYGENMMHLCRELFPTILETPGLLFSILDSSFAHSRSLYDDIIDDEYIETFKNYIYNRANNKTTRIKTNKTSKELLDEAGYILYECKTEEDIQKFKKYYARDEELCTFSNERLRRCHVFFAVKKNVDEIKRENFKKPRRQDEYGTSVISIQFSRGKNNTISIKNRYNHTVANPDATFSNNLDTIIPGLTYAFEKDYDLNINSITATRELGGYVLANDGKYYKYNYERNNIYYCSNNIIIDNFEVKHYDESRYIVFECFILDMKEKKLYQYENWDEKDDFIENDSFPDSIGNIENIEIINNRENNTKDIIINKDIIITINRANAMTRYINHHLTSTGPYFLYLNEELEELDLPNLETIDDYFLFCNGKLKELVLPNVVEIKDYCICSNTDLSRIYMPKVREIGNTFVNVDVSIKEIDLPNLEIVRGDFLHDGKSIEKVNLPKLEVVDDSFLALNQNLEELYLPNLTTMGTRFLGGNKFIKKVVLPKVESLESEFLEFSEKLEELDTPNVKTIGDKVLRLNNNLKELYLPKCRKIGNNCLECNVKLEKIDLPNVLSIGDEFCRYNKTIREVNMPKCKEIGDCFMYFNEHVEELDLPNCIIIGERFMEDNQVIERFSAEKLKKLGDFFLYYNNSLKELILPNLKELGFYCLMNNKVLEKLELDSLKQRYGNFGILDNINRKRRY